MKEIMSAEEWLKQRGCIRSGSENYDYVTPEDIIGFAKMHVKEALKQASQKALIHTEGAYDKRINTLSNKGIDLYQGHPEFLEYSSVKVKVDKESILNSYPLENIK